MLLDKRTQFHYFEILAPLYRDKTVLLACHKIGQHNKVVFTEAPSMGDQPYYIDGKTAKKCKKDSNGRLNCYAVSLDLLQPLELSINSEFDF